MPIELGRVGVWERASTVTPGLAREVERLGYGTIWVGGSPGGNLEIVEQLLDATRSVTIATGIVNMWKDDAETVAGSYHRIHARHDDRFLLGVGVGHPEITDRYQIPIDKIVDYLDRLDAEGVPAEHRILAALGPRVLELAARRSRGAHPYLTTPHHTRWARDVLGRGPLLAPEQKVVIDPDAGRAREVGRQAVRHYLNLGNYRRSLLRHGWTAQDLEDGGSDRLIDSLVAHGAPALAAEGVLAHLDAGADHVCIQALGGDPATIYRALAPVLT